MGQAVQKIDSANASMTRAALDATLATLTGVTAENKSADDHLGIQAPSAKDAGLVTKVFDARASAATSLAESVALATSPAASESAATASCSAAGAAIRAGDDAIGVVNTAFGSIRGVTHHVFKKWSGFGTVLDSSGCAGFVHNLRANPALALRSALKLVAISVLPSPVQVNGVPNPTTTTTSTTVPLHSTTTTTTTTSFGVSSTTSTSTTTTTTLPVTTTTLQIPPSSARSVLPPTGSVTADVVVANTGTLPVKHVTVTISVVASSGEEVGERVNSATVIGPDSSAYLTIGPVHLGKLKGTFELKVAASANGVAAARQVITLVRSA
jgi:hypothetical protein